MRLLDRIREKARASERAYKSFLKVQEFEQKTGLFSRGYGCEVRISAESLDDFRARLSALKGVLLAWQDARGDRCSALEVHVSTDPTLQLAADDMLQKLTHEDEELKSFLRRLHATVTLSDLSGKRIMKYDWGDNSTGKALE